MIKQVKNEKIQQNTLFLETAESPLITDTLSKIALKR